MRTMMTAALLFAVAAALCVCSPAQVVATSAYQVGYITVGSDRIINTGQTGSPMSPDQGTMCADIFAFDANQEMFTCCSCPVTANGMIAAFPGRPLTGVFPPTTVFKVVADAGCDETSVSQPVNGGLRVFLTSVDPPVRESIAEQVPLTAQEQQFLGQACAFVHYLGSGRGQCGCVPDPADWNTAE